MSLCVCVRVRACMSGVSGSVSSPFKSLQQAPAAAQALAGAIRRKHRGRLHNRGVGEEAQLRAILSYLDATATDAGLETGLGDGVRIPYFTQEVCVCLPLISQSFDTESCWAAAAQVLPEEPWERLSVEDGTGPDRDYRGTQTWHEKVTLSASLSLLPLCLSASLSLLPLCCPSAASVAPSGCLTATTVADTIATRRTKRSAR